MSAIVTLAVAVGGWIVAYFLAERSRQKSVERDRNDLQRSLKEDREERKRNIKIKRLNEKIEKLYGPLHAQLTSGQVAWQSFWNMHAPAHGKKAYFISDYHYSEEELANWRNWVENVLQPINREISKIIINNAHLIETQLESNAENTSKVVQESVYPNEFIEILAHTKAYDAVVSAWESGDFANHTSDRNFPPSLAPMVATRYAKLVAERDKLEQL